MTKIRTLLWIVFSISSIVHGNVIDLEKVKEGPCIVPPVDQNFDLLWLASYPVWYYPAWSKYELYKWTIAISGLNARNITEDIAERSCMILYISTDGSATQTAFNGAKKANLASSIADHAIFNFAEKRTDGTRGFNGKTYITLSDNQYFYVSVSCSSENQKSYTVHSTVKSLDPKTIVFIKNHLRSLGFDVAKTWVDMTYDDCFDLRKPSKRRKPADINAQASSVEPVRTANGDSKPNSSNNGSNSANGNTNPDQGNNNNQGNRNPQFGNGNNQQGFGNQNNQGFGNQNNQGFGNPNNQGFGNGNNQRFGNQNQGFGNQGFGNQNNQGFGNQNQGHGNQGFGNNRYGNNNGGGFGNNNYGNNQQEQQQPLGFLAGIFRSKVEIFQQIFSSAIQFFVRLFARLIGGFNSGNSNGGGGLFG